MRTRPARIEPCCHYCDHDHDPAITCRNVAECMQQEMRPPLKPVKRQIQIVRDVSGKTIGIRTEID